MHVQLTGFGSLIVGFGVSESDLDCGNCGLIYSTDLPLGSYNRFYSECQHRHDLINHSLDFVASSNTQLKKNKF